MIWFEWVIAYFLLHYVMFQQNVTLIHFWKTSYDSSYKQLSNYLLKLTTNSLDIKMLTLIILLEYNRYHDCGMEFVNPIFIFMYCALNRAIQGQLSSHQLFVTSVCRLSLELVVCIDLKLPGHIPDK